MVLNNIEKLLEKYENGETTLKEEQQLKHYFTQETVPPHLEVYKPMFEYFMVNQEEQFTKDVPLKTKSNPIYKWISVAAVAVLMFGIFTQISSEPKTIDDLSPKELMAYNQTVEALDLVSSQLTKGTENMTALNLMSSNFNKGTENISYLGEFSNTTNKIFNTNN
ncbi:MAG TPA: hypothetical protein VKN14_07040 [Flavobacteriaceae bacterium]|nr:hypothetical protein [Flavobacteriaceae bacterium]